MIIRESSSEDTDALLALAKLMHSESPFYGRYPFSDKKTRTLCEVFVNHHDWFCVVAEQEGELIGFMAVTIVPTFFGEARFLEDISFYVVPEKRGTSAALRLLRAVEAWGLANNVDAIRVGITTGTNPESAGNFFIKLGYEETGQLYSKLIGLNN